MFEDGDTDQVPSSIIRNECDVIERTLERPTNGILVLDLLLTVNPLYTVSPPVKRRRSSTCSIILYL